MNQTPSEKPLIVIRTEQKSRSLKEDLLCYSFMNFIKNDKNLDHDLYFDFPKAFPFLLKPLPTNSLTSTIRDVCGLSNTQQNYEFIFSPEMVSLYPFPIAGKSEIYHGLELRIPAYVEFRPSSCFMYVQISPKSQESVKPYIISKIKNLVLDLSLHNYYIWSNLITSEDIGTDIYKIKEFGDMWEISKNCETFVHFNNIHDFQSELMDMNDYKNIYNLNT